MSGKETKVTITTNSKGAKTEVTEFGEAFAKTSKQIEVNGEIIKQSTTTNFKKAEDTFADFSKRISELGSKGADISKLSQDFNRLSSLKTDAPEREIKELGTAISELEKKFKTLNDFQFKQNLNIDANLFSGKIDSTQAEKLRDTLNSITVDNLNKGMATFQSEMKMAVSETSKMKVEMTAFKKNEEVLLSFTQRLSDLYDKGVNIDKLETQFNKLNTLRTDASEQEIKDLDKAIKELENSYKTLESFNTRMNASLKTNLLSGKIDLSDYEKLKNILNSITVDNLTKGMANFNSELALAKNRTADVKSQISTLEGSIAKMQSALQSAQSIATKSGNNAILNSSEYKNVNDQLQITKQYLEQVKNTGKTISLEALNKSVTSATNAVGQLNNKTKETQSGFKSVENALASMQVKLNNMKSTKLMDEGVINRLQTGLNNLATCTDKNSSAFKSYINEFNKTKEAERQVKQLQQALDKLRDAQKKAIIAEKIDTSQYSAVKNSINEIEQALNKVKSTGQTVNISDAMNRAKTSTDNLKSSLREATTQTTNLGTSIQNSLSRVGIYISVAQIVRGLINEFKEGINYVKELDRAFFDVGATMDITKSGFADMTSQVQEMAREMGISATAVMDVAKTYANATITYQEAIDKAKPSIMLSNITGFNTGEITKSVNSAINAFQMLNEAQDNSAEQAGRYGDVLVKVSQNMNYDFADGVSQLMDSIKESGNVARQAGMDIEEYSAVMGAMIEATGKSGSELANGFKMIVARAYSIRELGEELGMTTAELNKGSKALQKYGIEVVNTDGSLKPFGDVLRELAPQWDTMTEAERNWLAENVAGNRQRSIFISMMDTMTKSQGLYSQALDSSGTMMEVQEKYMDSLEGKMGRLTATTQTFWSNIINSNAVKGGVSALTSFIDVLNDLTDIFGGTLVGIVGFSALLYPLATKIMTAVGATSLWSGAQAILNAVISANPLLVFITACVGTIAVIKALVSHIETAQDRMEKMDEASQKFNDTVSKLNEAEVDLHTWGQLQRQLEDGNLTLEERNNIIDQSDALESELGTAIEGADGILKNNVLTWEEKKALILECIEAQKQANAKDLNDELDSQKKYEKRNEKLKENIQLYKDLGEAMNDPNLEDYTKNQYLEQMDNLAGKIKEGYTEVQKYNGIIDDSGEYLDIYGRKHLDVSEDTQQFVDGLLGIGDASGDAEEGLEGISDGLEEMSEEARQAKEHLDTMCDGVSDWNVDGVIDDIDEGFGRIISGAESVMDAVDELTKKFDEHKNGIELANTAVEEFNENGYLTGDTWDDIVSSGDMDLIAGLWLEASQAKEYYKNLSEGWQEERENTANAEIMLSALEKGLIDENSEAYQIAKQAEIDASNRAKAEKIAILDQEKNEAIAIETIKINEKYNKMLEDANNSYEVEMIKLEQQRAIAEARQGIEEQYSTDRQAIEEAQTEGVIAEHERQKQSAQDKTDFSKTKYNEEEAEFQKTTDANKT